MKVHKSRIFNSLHTIYTYANSVDRYRRRSLHNAEQSLNSIRRNLGAEILWQVVPLPVDDIHELSRRAAYVIARIRATQPSFMEAMLKYEACLLQIHKQATIETNLGLEEYMNVPLERGVPDGVRKAVHKAAQHLKAVTGETEMDAVIQKVAQLTKMQGVGRVQVQFKNLREQFVAWAAGLADVAALPELLTSKGMSYEQVLDQAIKVTTTIEGGQDAVVPDTETQVL